MAEENKQQDLQEEAKVEKTTQVEAVADNQEEKKDKVEGAENKIAKATAKTVYGEKKKFQKRAGKRPEKKNEFDQRIIDIARVTRVMKGGKRMSFRACVALGDKNGKIGIGLGKGADVTMAINKAVNKAKKDMVEVPMINETIPHEVYSKFKAAKILFKPAKKGRGVIAGGAVRVILELAGIKNVTSKIFGTNNKVTNANCTLQALRSLKRIETRKDKNENSEKKAKKIEKKVEKKENK